MDERNGDSVGGVEIRLDGDASIVLRKTIFWMVIIFVLWVPVVC